MHNCSALRAYQKSQAASSSSALPPDLDVVVARSEEDIKTWRGKRLADDRRAYQEQLVMCEDTDADSTETMEVDTAEHSHDDDDVGVAVGSGSHVTHGDDHATTTHGDDHVTHRGDHVTYGELTVNMDVPPLLDSVKTKLDSVFKKL